ncbi:MAG: PD-(D/E)XK nuclease family protein [Blastochloris sp.]|nr:PD-(D/E)XK nuclease family protein [Blastochloris sp.]
MERASLTTLPAPDQKLEPEPFAAWEETQASLESATLQACFDPAQNCQIWREKAFDCLGAKGRISGVFDRVHLFLGPEGRAEQAVIIDYKTESNPDPEKSKTRHLAQMELYREALSLLTGLETKRIAVWLLYTQNRHLEILFPGTKTPG